MDASSIRTNSSASHSPAYAAYFLTLLLLANTLSYADRHLFSILIPAIKQEFGVSDSLLGLIAGPGFIVSYIVLTMPLARLADRWSRRGVLAVAAATWSIATAACGIAVNIWQLAMARVVVGVGEAGGMPPSQSLVADLFSERRRTTAMGILSSGTYFGILLGLAGGAAIAGAWGWRAAFIALAVPGIPLAILIWLTGPKRRRDLAEQTSQSKSPSMIASIRTCMQIPSLRLLALGMGVYNIYGYAGAVWIPTYFMRSHGMTMLEAGAWLGVGAAIGGIAGSFASGAIVDALVPRNQRWQLRIPAIGFLISFPLTVIMFTLPGGAALHLMGQQVPWVAILSIFTAFLASLWMGPSFSAAARLAPPELRTQAIAMLVVIINLVGSMIGPVVAGSVSDLFTARFGEEALRYSMLLISLLMVLGGVIFWAASRSYARDLEVR